MGQQAAIIAASLLNQNLTVFINLFVFFLTQMKYKLKHILLIFFATTLGLSSCITEDSFDNDPYGNFDQLWQIIDEKYCYLDYKGIDWDAMGRKYRSRLSADMSKENLFEVMDSLLYQLKDGHVNLSASFNQTRFDFWGDSPRNFTEAIIENSNYLGNDYRRAAGMKYKILSDNIGYIYYESFSYGVGDGNLDEVLSYLAVCDGLIIDVRQNGGGNLTNSTKIAARFTNEKVHTGYIQHKTGTGHNDFSEPYAVYVEPSSRIKWQKPAVVLSNRHSYSATNDFINSMRYMPNTIIMGATSGGGSGMPFSSELPNGWSVRFSASPHLDRDKQHTEFGITPDIKVDMTLEDQLNGYDTIIEAAREYLRSEKI